MEGATNVIVACRLRPGFPVQCGTEAPFRSPLRWKMAAPRQEQPPAPAASVGPRRSPCAIWFFRSNAVLISRAMASFPDQSGRVNSLKQIDIHFGTGRHATASSKILTVQATHSS